MYLFTLAWIVNVLRSGGCFGFDWDQAPGGLAVCWPSPPTHNTPGYTRYTEYTWVHHGIHRIHSKDQELVWISEFVARRDARAAIVSCWPECSIDAQQRLRRIAQEIIFPPNQHKKCRACLTVMNFLCFCWWCNLLDTWVGLFNAFGLVWSIRTRTFVFF